MAEQRQPKPFMTYEQLIHKLKDEKNLKSVIMTMQ